MYETPSKMNSFSAYTSQLSSPISIETSFDVHIFQDTTMSNLYSQTPTGYSTEWQFSNIVKNQEQVNQQYLYFEPQSFANLTISNSQAQTYSYFEALPSWEFYQEARGNPPVTKIIQKKQKLERKSSLKKEESDQETPQNKKRNVPGLLFEAMITECHKDPSFLIEKEFEFQGFVKDDFLSQLKNYQKNQKTFNSIAKYALRALDQKVMSLVLMMEFLKCDWRYSRWLDQSKMDPEQKELLYKEEERILLIRKFEVVKEEVVKCLNEFRKWKTEDPVEVWDRSYAEALTQKIKYQNQVL